MSDLTGQTALVTGASRGIGRAIALELAGRGARVIGTGTSEESAQRVTTTLAEHGLIGQGEILDAGDDASVAELMARFKAAAITPTILVNNAGITRDGLLMRMSDSDWDDVINVNLKSLFRLSKACVRAMMKSRGGRIINITSVVGAMGNAGQCNYAAAKAGVMGFTKSLARELGPRGITVNAVAPGFIDTDMTDALDEKLRTELLETIPLGRLGTACEIAAVVAFLASPMAAYITGETLHVNGGMHMY